MKKTAIHPTRTGWAQACKVVDATQLIFVSGQVPVDEAGTVPPDIKGQCRQAWSNVRRQLEAGGMSLANLVKINIFLSDRRYIQDAYEVRVEVLGPALSPAMTILITGIYDERWLLEIEAIAAA